ncbi:dihydrodipicolinate synthase/N-acetylneuraminate lyase [Rhizobium mongolense]
MERCFGLQADAGVYGIIVCVSLGEHMTLEPEETLEILNIARSAADSKPVLMTVCESSTKRGAAAAKAAAKAGGSGFMVLPGVPYKSAPEETLTHVQTIAAAGGLPIMVYNNPIAYGVDVTIPMFEELAKNDLVGAFPKETVAVYKLVQAGKRHWRTARTSPSSEQSAHGMFQGRASPGLVHSCRKASIGFSCAALRAGK